MFPPDLPPLKNKPLYAYRVFAKFLSFFIIGFSSVILGILVFPVMRLVLHPKARFQKHGRRFISSALRFFVFIMFCIGAVKLVVEDRKIFSSLSSKIIVANHPSLLDVVMLLSLIPNADCIVNAYLKRNILSGVACQLYILGSRDYDDILETSVESLKAGNCLIIFPEGTRTPRNGRNVLKKGAARIAMASGCNIVPVHIGGTDKYGLGKKDPLFGFNTRDRYIYHLTIGNEINCEQYREMPSTAAAKLIMKEVESQIFPGRSS